MAKVNLENIHIDAIDKKILEIDAVELYISVRPEFESIKITNRKIFHEILKYFLGESEYKKARDKYENANRIKRA